jgi:hypothetical protein
VCAELGEQECSAQLRTAPRLLCHDRILEPRFWGKTLHGKNRLC